MKYKITLLIIFLFILYGHIGDFFDPIRPIHEWRKTDSFSIALNYMKGNSFAHPETQFISAYNNRAAAGEFPIVYYTIGKLWSIFGQHEWIGKLLTYITFYISLFLFSEVLLHYFRSEKKTILFTAAILSSPVLLFYSNTILPNIYSFSFLLISAYLVYKYLLQPRWYQAILLIIFLSLAILIKITALIAVLTFAGAAIIQYGFIQREIFLKHRRTALLFAFALMIAMLFTWLWYTYAIRYNALHKSDLFSTVIRPIWEVGSNDINRIWKCIWKYQFNLIFHLSVLLPSIGWIMYSLIRGKIKGFLLYAIIIGFIGVFTYIILWFWALEMHDYYLIEILFFPLLILFIIFKEIDLHSKKSYWLKSATVILFSIVTFTHALAFSQTTRGKNNIITTYNILLSTFVQGNWWFYNDYYNTHLGKLQRHVDDVRKCISPADTVLCINDLSPNIQLYTIDRLGITRMGFNQEMTDSSNIAELIERGADKILRVGEECIDTSAEFFYTDTLFYQDGIYVFDLSRHKKMEL